MLQVVFTLDYEIHGNGEGCPLELMVEPTERMLRLFDAFGAKLTIMADVAEILRFREFKAAHGHDAFHYDAIAAQLQHAVRSGHDVQLHIHSSYFNAVHHGGRWQQDWSEYDFARLPYARMHHMIRTGKEFLESLLQPVDPSYRCLAFRAANWSVSPSQNVVTALVSNAIEIDSSVFKYGRRDGLVSFDYTSAHSALRPWRASAGNICASDEASPLWEVPIYSERRWIGAFLAPGRVHRALMGRRHRLNASSKELTDSASTAPGVASARRLASTLLRSHAWKADFNQCSGQQLVAASERAGRAYDRQPATRATPFVLIGHSKLFTRANESRLQPFLAHAASNRERFTFATLREVHSTLPSLRIAASAPTPPDYVLVTPAHNEAANIERTIASVVAQSVRPRRWVIVDDASTDNTAELVHALAERHDFIRLIRLSRTGGRHFGNKVCAFNAGLAAVADLDYAFVGNLDADISLEPDYFATLLRAFADEPELGLAGGMVSTRIGSRFVSQRVALDSVAGAVQLFRRTCFEAIGGYIALPGGGIDSAAEIMARMKGWRVRTLSEVTVLEHRRTGTASAPPLLSKVREGQRLRSLGYGFGFISLRGLKRCMDPPRMVGSLATLVGYVRGALRREPLVLAPEVVRFLRQEQQRKVLDTIKGLLNVRHLRHP